MKTSIDKIMNFQEKNLNEIFFGIFELKFFEKFLWIENKDKDNQVEFGAKKK